MESLGTFLSASGFHLQKFVKQPQTVARALSWVFAVVVFSSVTAEGYVNPREEPRVRCVFNRNDGVCRYVTGVGVLAFILSICFLLLDLKLPRMCGSPDRKYVVAADLCASGVWTLLWFVCFCLTSDQWSKTSDTSGIPLDGVNAIIAFSFFSVASWAVLTYLALVELHQIRTGHTPNQPVPHLHTPSLP